ncbi:MAG: hypothetical protein IRZ10_01170 [Thermoflavifilum sp.]|nr:hypothetical protein [Thermoflavifilum sp.]MCL6512999.1 hypothetical protein [Alicyclobacillus sp.]
MRRATRLCGLWAALGVAAVLAGCGAVSSASGGTTPAAGSNAAAGAARFAGRGMFGGVNLQTVANVLKISVSTLQQDLQSGESILDVAKKQGVSEQTLENALVADEQSRINQMVQSGRITSDQGQQMLSRFKQMLPTLLSRKGLPAPPAGRGHWGGNQTGNWTGNFTGHPWGNNGTWNGGGPGTDATQNGTNL